MHLAASKAIGVPKMSDQENSASALPGSPDRKTGKWWGWGLSGLVGLAALKIYYVREMIAALVIFSVLFTIVAILVLAVFILDRVSQWTFAWVESCSAWLARQAASSGGAIAEGFRRRLHDLYSRPLNG